MSPKIGLVYLNRRAEGNLPVRRLIDSYKTFNPGVDHEFITIYKGFTDNEIDVAKRLAKGVEHRHISVDDEMTDIDSYLIAAESFSDVDLFCFLNTFSEIACENWLLYLFNAISNVDIGIAGATSSYESLLNSFRLILKVIWLCEKDILKYDRHLYLQYKTTIDKNVPNWLQKHTERHEPLWLRKHLVGQLIYRLRTHETDNSYTRMHDASFEEFWKISTAPDAVYSFLNNYPPFPNPHIRSNGFMVKRAHLLPFFNTRRRMSKHDSYLFESGAASLTRQIQSKKLKAVTVNNSGNIFDVEQWPQSQTFRLGKQRRLLIHDNQSRNFQRFNSAEKDLLAYMT